MKSKQKKIDFNPWMFPFYFQLVESCDAHKYCDFHFAWAIYNIPSIPESKDWFHWIAHFQYFVRDLDSYHQIQIRPMGVSNFRGAQFATTHRFHCVHRHLWNQFLFRRRVFKQQNLGQRTQTQQIQHQKTQVIQFGFVNRQSQIQKTNAKIYHLQLKKKVTMSQL